MANYDAIINRILLEEGGFVNNPKDKGSATNFGITQATLASYLHRPVTVDEVRTLDVNLAKEIYISQYITGPRLDTLYEIDQHLADQVVDIGVNSGPRNAIKMLQRVVNSAGFGPIDVDGALGPGTRDAVDKAFSAMGDYLNNALVEERVNFYNQIVARDPSQGTFLAGWTNRAQSFVVAV